MSTFSLICVAKEDELYQKYRLLNIFGYKFLGLVKPYIPDYLSGYVKDLGVEGHSISCCRICIPPSENTNSIKRKLKSAIGTAGRFGSKVFIIDPKVSSLVTNKPPGVKISTGNFYPPLAFIDAVKAVSSLMAIDFRRCNVCIADACTDIGRIMTEHLLDEVLSLTLCTYQRENLMGRIGKYILKSGLSPAVASDFRKAMKECDVLIYTGGTNIRELAAWSQKKVLFVNMTEEKLSLGKDLMLIDEVILKGGKDPIFSEDETDRNIFLTSKSWEGALLTISDINTNIFSIKKSLEIGNLARQLGIKISGVMTGEKLIRKEDIYRYR